MKTQNSDKLKYKIPEIVKIKLDNEISLALESTPPTYESVNSTKVHENFNNDSFKSNIV
jgi:hypothetical protein